MTQEDKQLLLQDLCSRLPYGVICDIYNDTCTIKEKLLFGGIAHFADGTICLRPHLRPLLSMTEEEKKDLLVNIVGNECSKYFQVLSDGSIDNTDDTIQDLNKFNIHWVSFDKDTVTLYLDWLNAHHFDYRSLIERGLAIAVTEDNNPYKE